MALIKTEKLTPAVHRTTLVDEPIQ